MNAQCYCKANRTFSKQIQHRRHLLHQVRSISCSVTVGHSDPAAAAQRVPQAAAAAAAASNAAADAQQVALTESTMQDYVRDTTELSQLLGGCQGLKVQQLLDGVINMVYRGMTPTCCVLLGISTYGQQSVATFHSYKHGCCMLRCGSVPPPSTLHAMSHHVWGKLVCSNS
jgi:hypothetical protein